MRPFQYMMPRLEGADFERGGTEDYIALVRQGIAGFILFGGALDGVREGIALLQENSELPLLIGSDLEQGLGQQVAGGTLFPPAMAFGAALANGLEEAVVRGAFRAMAEEALHAGINLVFAPVMDINSNPENPIIAARAFGEDPASVSRLGEIMISELQGAGVLACGKHFPGHGDTSVDSHLALPTVQKSIDELEGFELVPFARSIRAGVRCIMTGHLSVPALDPSGLPATLSRKAVRYLREKMGFRGIVTTDAMNMAGIAMPEEKASELAMRAGADILLHPSLPWETAEALEKLDIGPSPMLVSERGKLPRLPAEKVPDFATHRELARKIERASVTERGDLSGLAAKTAVVLSDSPEKLESFINALKARGLEVLINPGALPSGRFFAVTYSYPRGWHPPSERLKEDIRRAALRGPAWVSFGNPYLAHGSKDRLICFSVSKDMQLSIAEKILSSN